MTKKIRILCIFVSLFAFTFFTIGYAALSKSLNINGYIGAAVQEGIFIFMATPVTTNATVNGFSSTILNSKVDLGNDGTSTAVIEVTVYNNYPETYGFNGYKYNDGNLTFDNQDYTLSVDIKRGTEVESGNYLTFNVTFSYVDSIVPANTVLNSIIQFEFLVPDQIVGDEEDAAVGGALARFEEILNNSSELNSVLQGMGENNFMVWGDFVGNVGGADQSDLTLLNGLFEGDLSMIINGKEEEVTVLIKREQVDNNTSTGISKSRPFSGYYYQGHEMTIYLTTNLLNEANTSAATYAAVYTKYTSNGTWTQVGPTYHGEAPVTDYTSGAIGGTGSFNTDNWRTVEVEGKYAAGLTIQQVVALGLRVE